MYAMDFSSIEWKGWNLLWGLDFKFKKVSMLNSESVTVSLKISVFSEFSSFILWLKIKVKNLMKTPNMSYENYN